VSGSNLPVFSPDLTFDQRVVTSMPLPGDGFIESGTLGTSEQLPFIMIRAGTVALTAALPGAYTLAGANSVVMAPAPNPLTVDAGSEQTVILPDATSPMRVTVHGSDGIATAVSLSFGEGR
jgi:hypothetical protein